VTALAETQARIASIRKLRTVVGAMRGIAASHAQQARQLLPGFRAYAEVVASGLARAADLLPPGTGAGAAPAAGGGAVVVFAAEHGLAGAFSDHVLAALPPAAGASLFVVGARGVALAEQRGRPADWSTPMASRASGVGATARHVADALYAGFVAGRLAKAEIVYARLSATTESTVVRRPILPIELGALRRPHAGPAPLTNLPPRRLIEQLIGEYVFAELALAALESFASENAARLTTMESARLNIEKKLDGLSGEETLLRQEQITAEVQEVTSGALASEASSD
jgi:F-type H+-transporting ATPase subunit gamma